jgi:hypothetical protein
MPEQKHAADADGRREQLLQRLEQSRWTAPFVAVAERFAEIDGSTQGGLVSIQLFTTVIPLMIIGFGYFSGFAVNVSVGEVLIRDLGLHPPLDARVRGAFGTASALHSLWSVVGVAGFLAAGIPMSITIAGMFARAWRRQQFGMAEKLARGAIWFVLYLWTMVAREQIGFSGQHGAAAHAALLVAALIPQWVFWSLTPVLLVRDGGRGWRYLLLSGFAGVVIDGVVLAAVARVVFPLLLEEWTPFGPMGVAMTLMTWCGVAAIVWAVIACAGAILWERNAPAATVIDSQTAMPVLPAVAS